MIICYLGPFVWGEADNSPTSSPELVNGGAVTGL